jgi:hypothetical protein
LEAATEPAPPSPFDSIPIHNTYDRCGDVWVMSAGGRIFLHFPLTHINSFFAISLLSRREEAGNEALA